MLSLIYRLSPWLYRFRRLISLLGLGAAGLFVVVLLSPDPALHVYLLPAALLAGWCCSLYGLGTGFHERPVPAGRQTKLTARLAARIKHGLLTLWAGAFVLITAGLLLLSLRAFGLWWRG